MDTPIRDMLLAYAERDPLRLHMPGHKGAESRFDITEVEGADSLFSPTGVIKRSEENAGRLFGAKTYYSTEGSSLSIRAMLYLATLYAKKEGKAPLVLAARNVHRSFVSAMALIDFDVEWLYSRESDSYLSCRISAEDVEARFKRGDRLPSAVYLTSPDYLGQMQDIGAIAKVCKKYGALLLVDNAHGAYLKLLPESKHPIDLGADMCCDSAHKTLPALTGSAYLHISHAAPSLLSTWAKDAMALFGSTSPSYLILDSLDRLNKTISDGFSRDLSIFVDKIPAFIKSIEALGYENISEEPLKITLKTKQYGYFGYELAKELEHAGVVCEFYDSDFLVMMLSPYFDDSVLLRIYSALASIKRREAIKGEPPVFTKARRAISAREAMSLPRIILPVDECVGRVLADVTVGCPPAVPIVVSGETVDESAIEAAHYYGINEFSVIDQ